MSIPKVTKQDVLNASSEMLNKDLYVVFTKPENGRRGPTVSSKGLDQFIEQLTLNDCSKKNILFPYFQGGFLPIKCALLNPNTKVTTYNFLPKGLIL